MGTYFYSKLVVKPEESAWVRGLKEHARFGFRRVFRFFCTKSLKLQYITVAVPLQLKKVAILVNND